MTTDVLIVGAGPVGLALALDLAHRGVDFTVLEAGDGTVRHPKVSTVGPRSMELFRRWGVAGRIHRAGWPGDHPLDVAWVTRVGGHELHRLRRGTADTRPVPDHTPEPDRICPAHWLTPLLLDEVGVHPKGPVLTRHRLDGVVRHADGVVAEVTDLDSGRTASIAARYLVACDGSASPVRELCGIGAPPRHETRVFRNILFRAPELRDGVGDSAAMVYFLMASPSLRFPLRSIDGAGLYNLVVGTGEGPEARSLVTDAIAFETPFEILSDKRWYLTHRVADRFRDGPVFLVGDAAHTLSPSGGFGLSTGIAGAADLGWKLAATLAGWAGGGLLDSYEAERRPVAAASLEAANANLVRTIDRSTPAGLDADTPEGARARAEVSRALAAGGVAREFDDPEVHFGLRYSSPLIVTEPDTGAAESGPWHPAAVPGSRAPHAWLRPGVSTLDLFGRGFVLLCFPGADRPDTVARAFTHRGVPLEVMRCGCADPELAKLYERRYVLVRPDGHVAWRGDEPPADPLELVDTVRGARTAARP
ncbi:FAD-dependent oxidoreductase [Saccharothrix violaceirubra]|uniref:2-polyprenyl-6-methoxyphenol hydroxylase-like FAD-dependent oxidoreductase n=1 Tax=Saccharothrix violaceirubra TaxID=413306 RepID=A0A7W7T493_9PSEU|nr:FAD-dependent monooxygenase [Saccharothrix violaceirubra]MBB4966279.1 2-polyprenyl-6-methoxyphenol hydroxylase-like FAD-dependent oxidoreductase [Saccharothrix violaceirubra]